MGKSRIKGITIQIDGDTTGLNKALSGTDKAISKTQSELKEVERLLKLDPKNTELLKQKQELLAKAVSETKKKLDALKEASKQAAKTADNYDAWKNKYDPIQKEIDETKKKLSELKKGAKEAEEGLAAGKISTEQYEAVKKEVKETEEKLKQLQQAAKECTEEFGNPISPDQYNALQREIVETEQNLKSMEEQAKKSKSAIEKIKAAGDKLTETGDKISKTGKKLLPVTGGIVAAGAAAIKTFDEVDNGMDIIIKKTGATGKAAEGLQKIYEDLASEMPAEFDDIGAAVGEINTRLGFTGEKLEDSSRQFLKFARINDIDVNSAVQLVTRAMGDAGMEADSYGGLLDELTVAAQASGISIDKLTEYITKYGAPMRNLGFDTQSSIAIFSQWEKAGVNTEIAFSGMKKAISNWMAAGKDAKTEFASFIAGVKDGSISAQEALEVFGAKAGPDLVDAIQQGRFSYEEFLKIIEDSGGIVDSTYDGVIDGVDQMKVATQNAKLAMAELGDSILSVLAPIIKELTEKLKEFTQWFRGLSPETKEMIVKIALVAAALGPVIILIGKIVAGVGSLIKIIGLIASPVGLVVTLIGMLVGAFIYLWNTSEDFRNFWTGLWESIKEIASTVADALVNFFTVKIPEAWKAVQDFFEGIPKWWWDLWTEVKNNLADIWNSIKETAANIWTGITQKVSSVASGLANGVSSTFNRFAGTLQSIWSGISSAASNIWSGVKGFVVSTATNIKDMAVSAFQKLVAGVGNTLGNIGTVVKNGFQSAINFITSLPSKALQWGKDFINGIINGITSMVGGVIDAVGGIAGAIADFLHFSRPDKGPLHYYEEWMPDFVGGMADGIKKNAYLVKNAVSDLASGMSIEGKLRMETEMGTVKEKETSGMQEAFKEVVEAVKGHGHPIVLNDGTLVGRLAPGMNISLKNERMKGNRGMK